MRVPVWLTLGVAALVIVFGAYRISLALKKPPKDGDPEAPKRSSGLYRMKPRTHALIGIVYLLLGGALIGVSFGWNPFGSAIGPSTETPPKDKAPTKGGVPIDTIPSKK